MGVQRSSEKVLLCGHFACLGKLRIWEENFLSYFNASNVDVGEMATQQNFLRASLDPDLVTLLKQRINDETDILTCITHLKDIFLESDPLFACRWRFLGEKQPIGESFSVWYAKLDAMARDADILKMSIEEMYTILLIAMTTDCELQKKLLNLCPPTRQEVLTEARAFEANRTTREKLGNVTSDQSRYAGNNRPQHQQQNGGQRFEGACNRCSKLGHKAADCRAANKLTCSTCMRPGHVAGAWYCKIGPRAQRGAHGSTPRGGGGRGGRGSGASPSGPTRARVALDDAKYDDVWEPPTNVEREVNETDEKTTPPSPPVSTRKTSVVAADTPATEATCNSVVATIKSGPTPRMSCDFLPWANGSKYGKQFSFCCLPDTGCTSILVQPVSGRQQNENCLPYL